MIVPAGLRVKLGSRTLELWAIVEPTGTALDDVGDGATQSRQKSLKRVVLNSVYLTVCWIERCPSQSWIARVSAPALAKA
jgi:hypothetical protein